MVKHGVGRYEAARQPHALQHAPQAVDVLKLADEGGQQGVDLLAVHEPRGQVHQPAEIVGGFAFALLCGAEQHTIQHVTGQPQLIQRFLVLVLQLFTLQQRQQLPAQRVAQRLPQRGGLNLIDGVLFLIRQGAAQRGHQLLVAAGPLLRVEAAQQEVQQHIQLLPHRVVLLTGEVGGVRQLQQLLPQTPQGEAHVLLLLQHHEAVEVLRQRHPLLLRIGAIVLEQGQQVHLVGVEEMVVDAAQRPAPAIIQQILHVPRQRLQAVQGGGVFCPHIRTLS